MHILFIAPRIPFPPRKGDQLRAYHQLKGLKKLGHDLHLICYSDEEEVPEELKNLCSRIMTVKFKKSAAIMKIAAGMMTNTPVQVSYYESNAFRQAIKEAVSTHPYDVVHTQLVRTYPYFEELKELPNVLDFVDSISLNLSRRIAFKKSITNPLIKHEARTIHLMERQAMECFDGSIFISNVDRNYVGDEAQHVATISNGVDLHYFSYQKKLSEQNNLIFVGNMSYEPNRQGVKYFIENIYPHIMRKTKDFTFYVVGRDPTPDLIQLCRDKPNITVTGEVDDIRDYLAKAKLFVCPLKTGAGVQNKVLEAMSAGIPVLTTSIVNDPIGAVESESVVVRNQDQEFADAAVDLLSDQNKLEDLRQSARSFVEENYEWDRLNQKLEQFYRETMYKRNNVFGKESIHC